MKIVLKPLFPAALVSLFLLLVSCTTQLAPAYDRAVAEGLINVNPDVMTLLASLSNGTDKNTFATREETYNRMIGRLDALTILAGARPMPKNAATDHINKLLRARNDAAALDEDDVTPPSAHAIKKISETLAKARDADRRQGLSAYEAQAVKGQIIIYFDQAITYENFLQR